MAGKKPQTTSSTLRSLFCAALLALLFRTTCVQAFSIPTGSATPTLQTGDTVLVTKFAYGYSRYSLPWAPAFLHGRILFSQPKRGDVVVFANPKNGVITLKRLVGLPGDEIQVVRGILTINGQQAQRERDGTFVEKDWDEAAAQPVLSERYRYVETMPNGVKHAILGVPTSFAEDAFPVDSTGVYVVPAGHYFGMGDSRDNSEDSRFLDQLGYIPAENLIGRADFRLISLKPGAHLWEIWKWPSALRLQRFFGRVT